MHQNSGAKETFRINSPYNAHNSSTDEVLPRQCPCLRDFDLWSVCGHWRIRRLQTETWHTREFTQVRPPWRVKTYILLVWSCIAGIVWAVQWCTDEIWRRWKKMVCTSLCTWDLCEIRLSPFLGRPSSPLYGGRGLAIRSKSVTGVCEP
jgi:hypothetical protein